MREYAVYIALALAVSRNSPRPRKQLEGLTVEQIIWAMQSGRCRKGMAYARPYTGSQPAVQQKAQAVQQQVQPVQQGSPPHKPDHVVDTEAARRGAAAHIQRAARGRAAQLRLRAEAEQPRHELSPVGQENSNRLELRTTTVRDRLVEHPGRSAEASTPKEVKDSIIGFRNETQESQPDDVLEA